jgi:hypothetical protein
MRETRRDSLSVSATLGDWLALSGTRIAFKTRQKTPQIPEFQSAPRSDFRG